MENPRKTTQNQRKVPKKPPEKPIFNSTSCPSGIRDAHVALVTTAQLQLLLGQADYMEAPRGVLLRVADHVLLHLFDKDI